MDESDALLHLALIPALGSLASHRLVEVAGSAGSVRALGMDRLMAQPGVGGELARRICDPRAEERVAQERAAAHRLGVRLLTRDQPGYPAAFLRLADPPLALWLRGEFQERDRLSVAVVGSRRPSAYAHRQAQRLAGQLARAGACIIGGLSRGVETVAHEAALSGSSRTIAVLGSGFGRLYPEENRPLADRIAASGVVLSELPISCSASALTFPQRNRLIAALALATVVIEAGTRSGAVALARMASELGQEVLVVPGQIDSPECAGSNRLIRDGATLLSSVEDIFEEVPPLATLAGPLASVAAGGRQDRSSALTGRERMVYQLLNDQARSIDDLARVTTVAPSSLAAARVSLELKRLVRKLPGGYVRAT